MGTEQNSISRGLFESPFYSKTVAGVLERDLGLGMNKVCLLLLPGNHVPTTESWNFLRHAHMIGGEVTKDMLIYSLITEPPVLPSPAEVVERIKRFRNPGLGASPDEKLYRHKVVRELVKEGKTFVTSDGSTEQIARDYDPVPLQLLTVLGLWGEASLYGSGVLASGISMKAMIDRRQFMALGTGLVGMLSLMGGTMGATYWYNSLDDPRNIRLGRNSQGEKMNHYQRIFERIKERLGLESNIFETYSGSLVEVRNASKGLDNLQSLATSVSRDRPEPLVMALLYGNSHGEIEDLLAGGVSQVIGKVEGFAASLLTDSLEKLINIHDKEFRKAVNLKEISPSLIALIDQNIIEHLAGYAKLFPEPHKVGGPQWPEDNLAASMIPPSARTVLFDEARELIAQHIRDGTGASLRRAGILSGFVSRLVQDAWTERAALAMAEAQFTHGYPFKKEIAQFDSYDALGENSFLLHHQYSAVDIKKRAEYSYIYSNYNGPTIKYALLKFHGSYCPVLRVYSYDRERDTVIASDTASLRRNQVVKLPQREYARADSLDFAPDDLLVRIKEAQNGKLKIFLVDPWRNQYTPSDSEVYYEGGASSQTDPLRVGLVSVELA